MTSYLILFFSLFTAAQDLASFEIIDGDTVNQVDNKGLKQGKWVQVRSFKGEKRKIESFYIDGQHQHSETGYYDNGQIFYTTNIKDSLGHGFYSIYYKTGGIKETGIWRNGKNIGEKLNYYRSGTVSARSVYNDRAQLEGAQIEFHPNEIIGQLVMYKSGVKTEFAIRFDSLGNRTETMYFENDALVEYSEEEHPEQAGTLTGILDYVSIQNQLIFTRDSILEHQRQLELSKVESDAEIREQRAELRSEETRRYFLYGGVGLLLLFGGFMYNRFRVTHRQKGIIEEQKHEIEEVHQEITDSIEYAKRIQSAILPPQSMMDEHLPNSFVLYLPKDVVAGDFYWMEHLQDQVIFAAADCTGHGVPGAMVSVLCVGGLNRAVREYGLVEPGKILDKTREIIIEEFERSEEEVKDGMDIALCALKGKTLHFAGAHNPLWIIRKGANEVEEVKANKQPIGKFIKMDPYLTHEVQLNEGDTFYVFSDGYPDQFGGEKGKKFKSKNFKDLLVSIQSKPMEEHQVALKDAFENWRGSFEQIDDVVVIGVRV